jgi:acetyltransferase-like isoleucine patch superfamily enzyme
MKVVIIGAGSVAHIAADIINNQHNFSLKGFIGTSEEDKKFKERDLHGMGAFLGDHTIIPHLYEDDVFGFIVAIGDNYLREKYFYECVRHNLQPVNAISVDAIVRRTISVGKGVIISPGALISTGVEVGNNVIIESGVICNVGAKIGDHSNIRSGTIIGGMSKIGKNVYVGPRSYIKADVGKNNEVPFGANITTNIEDKYREE